jgi:lysophospholipase L1-like esterase
METTDDNPSLFVSLRNSKYGDKFFDEITFLFDNSENLSVEIEGFTSDVISEDSNHIKLKLESSVSEAKFLFKNKGHKLSLSGLVLENSASKVVYNSAGLNGADVKSYLRAGKLMNHLSLIHPQLVIISLGTNDAYHPLFNIDTFSEMLDSLISSVKRATPKSTILLTIPGDHLVSRTSSNPNLLLAKEAIITSAFENNCCVWDFHSLMGGEGGVRVWNSMGLTAPDLLHLSVKGYQLQGELLFEALTTSE